MAREEARKQKTPLFHAAVVLAAALALFRFSQPAPGTKVALLHELEAAGAALPTPAGRRIALGWNTCVDMLVDLPAVARRLDLAPQAALAEDHAKVHGNRDLEATVSYWFSRGGAAERLVGTGEGGGEDAAAAFFNAVVEAARGVEGSRYRVGGNAALMATNLARLGCKVQLGGPIGDTLAGLLDPRIDTVSPTREDDGGSVTDAVHLILEYQKDQTMGDMAAPRANRFILVHDPLNARLAGLETLSSAVAGGGAPMDAFVASGLNQLEALAPAEREARLRDVRSALSDLPPSVPIHLELASMADETFAYRMASTLFPLADSFGLNEQELAYIFESLGGRYRDYGTSADALTGKTPDVHAVTSALEFVLKRADEWSLAAGGGDDDGGGAAANSIRRISRVHFHCLSYHIIVERDVPGRERWGEDLWRATAQGAVAATNNACGPATAASPLDALKRLVQPEYFEESDLELLYDKPCRGERRNGVCYWSSENEGTAFSLAPVLVCAHPRNTVGLGDAISSTGLAYSLK